MSYNILLHISLETVTVLYFLVVKLALLQIQLHDDLYDFLTINKFLPYLLKDVTVLNGHICRRPCRGHFEGERRVGTPFPMLKCLRTHYGRHCKPFSSQKCTKLQIQAHIFSVRDIPGLPQAPPGGWVGPRHQFSLGLFLFYETTTAPLYIACEPKMQVDIVYDNNDGAMLTAVCHRGCANGGQCVEPEVCQCTDPYVGLTCRENKQGELYIG